MNDVMPDIYVDLNAGMHDDYIIPVDRLNVAGADQSTHSVLSTNIESDNYVPIDGITCKHTWDLPTIININARSLNANKTTNGDCTELANKMNDFFPVCK